MDALRITINRPIDHAVVAITSKMRDEMPMRTTGSRIGPSDSNESRSIAALTNHPANPPTISPKTVIPFEARPGLVLTALVGTLGAS